ncbi:membrane-bound lytic murein transglycosylase MltF [Pontibacter sp. JAM-7]|uniref:membrane-bound lytic murein transglycosylase MltF n=1 Tax=Pontibacter sp. JAM-7 TaxID=3366581 RepID=UPI003AF48723
MFDLRRKKDAAHALLVLLVLCIPALLSWNSKTQLGAIQEAGVIKLVTRNSPNTYFLEKGEPAGFEYELGKAFADFLGVKLELIVPLDFSSIFTTMRQRDGHVAAAMLTATPEREQDFAFSPAYLETAAVLVYRITQGQKKPQKLTDAATPDKQLMIIADSSHASLMQSLKLQQPELVWQETSDFSSVELMEMVHNQEIDYTIVDSVAYNAQHSFFPGLATAMEIGEPQPLAWMINPYYDNSLALALQRFFERETTQELIEQLKTKYFQRQNPLNFYDTAAFREHMQSRFPSLEQYFMMGEQETDIDWHLLAAVAYQESHWNPDAVSPTGVRGIMMLTNAAAADVGVTDRTDPQQSIIGGAHYLTQVMDKIPERIQGEDRVWFALAGYNVGFGHLEDARKLTSQGGKNPDNWDDVKQFLPLLTQEKYYTKVRYGYARGYEPVQYVRNIRRYLKLLRWEIQLLQARRLDAASDHDPDHPSWDPASVKENILPSL